MRGPVRCGVKADEPYGGADDWYWPEAVTRDLAACGRLADITSSKPPAACISFADVRFLCQAEVALTKQRRCSRAV